MDFNQELKNLLLSQFETDNFISKAFAERDLKIINEIVNDLIISDWELEDDMATYNAD